MYRSPSKGKGKKGNLPQYPQRSYLADQQDWDAQQPWNDWQEPEAESGWWTQDPSGSSQPRDDTSWTEEGTDYTQSVLMAFPASRERAVDTHVWQPMHNQHCFVDINLILIILSELVWFRVWNFCNE